MSNDAPENLKASHLVYGLAPEQTKEDVVELERHYDSVLARIDGKLAIVDLIKGRIKDIPEITAQETLGDLVKAARKRLRQNRLQVDLDELRARRYVAAKVREALGAPIP
jgi:hypothetical protein